MRDYIILNGKRSTLVRGLMICKLPPITKPALRTTTTTIDGRDGDIVTPLGYQSYDKEIEIGLHGDYDVDEVISYFDSSGTVTFSNEITKYYRYRIDNQIDFEKLLRFRTAKVTLHVQPFKYSTTDQPVIMRAERPIISVPNYNRPTPTINGLTITSINDGKSFGINGTATINTEIYIPIYYLRIERGESRLDITTSAESNNADKISIMLIRDDLSHAFGESNPVTLEDGETRSTTGTLSNWTQYNYLYLYIESGAPISTEITPIITYTSGGINESVTNSGNTIARPKIKITGKGKHKIKLRTLFQGDTEILEVNLGDTDSTMIIDSENQEAYDDSSGTVVLKNRAVTGDYSDVVFPPGSNTITTEMVSQLGYITSIQVERYSRWI